MEYTTTLASELAEDDESILAAADSAGEDSKKELDAEKERSEKPEVNIPVSEEILLSTSRGTNSGSASSP